MARELHRRVTRLEHQGRRPGVLVRQWMEWLRNWEGIFQQTYPDYHPRSEPELLGQAKAEAAAGRTPAQAWTEALISVWQERGRNGSP
jgi:hypothetical protein